MWCGRVTHKYWIGLCLPNIIWESSPPWWCTGRRSTWRRWCCRRTWCRSWVHPISQGRWRSRGCRWSYPGARWRGQRHCKAPGSCPQSPFGLKWSIDRWHEGCIQLFNYRGPRCCSRSCAVLQSRTPDRWWQRSGWQTWREGRFASGAPRPWIWTWGQPGDLRIICGPLLWLF